MRERYLEITYRKGNALAAYLYLPRTSGTKSRQTRRFSPYLLVDYAEDGTPIGVEITGPNHVSLENINDLLSSIGQTALSPEEVAPLQQNTA